MCNLTVAHLRDDKKNRVWTSEKPVVKKPETSILPKSTTQKSLQNGQRPRYAIEAEERTPSLLIVRRAEQRLALAQKLLRRRAPRVVFRKRNRVDRHAPTCAVQADLDP